MARDFYTILEVDRGADEKVLKSAFRKAAMKYHPDRNPGDETAEAAFKELNQAYEVLKDPQKRAAYDRFGHDAFTQGGMGQGGGAGGAGFGPDFSSSMSDIFDDLFGDFMGGGGARRGGRTTQARGSDLRYNLEISLEDAFEGSTVKIDVPSLVACETCTGSGAKPGTGFSACTTCHGHGKIRAAQGFFTIERTCPACQGRGETLDQPCTDCSGQGRSQQTRNLSIDVPAGIEDGTRIRLSGEGETGQRGGPAGDLYIFVSILPHELFAREGADLHARVPISMAQAALGGEFEVPSIGGGKARVKIDPGTQGGQKVRLKAKGMSVLRSNQLGDLYVQLDVETPSNLSKRQRELLEEFAELSDDKNSPKSAGFFDRLKNLFD